MSGILDPKTRVIDTVITQEGKRQIASGGLRALYATVSDKHSFYELDVVSGSTDATRRLHYEPPIENNNDSIIMEHDDSGGLLGYPMSGPQFISNDGSIYTEQTIGSETSYRVETKPSIFASTADKVIATAIDRFTNLQTIGTRDPDESLSLQMKIKPTKHTFTMNNKFPFVEGFQSATTNIDYVEPLFFDEMLANSPNFQFLPPVTREVTRDEQKHITEGFSSGLRIVLGEGTTAPQNAREIVESAKSKLFGSYTKYHKPASMTLEDIMRHLNVYPELRRMTDYANRTAASAVVVDSDTTAEVLELLAYPIRDPDADEDERREYHAFAKPFSYEDKPLAEPDADGTKKFNFDTRDDSYGVYKSEENSTSVNLSNEQLPRERVQVFFNPTSSTNNIIMQMFEVNSKSSKLLKLDVIHYDEFLDPSDAGRNRPVKNVFFAGKIFVNSIGLPTFINLFTIILD